MKLDFRALYRESIVPKNLSSHAYSNPHQVPKILKICINCGISHASSKTANQLKELDSVLRELSLIAGLKPKTVATKKSIAGFNIRDGMIVGATVTLRGARMYSFLEKLIHLDLPRVRDFKGIDAHGDGAGNYSFGITDQLVFPEISYESVDRRRGFDISIVTSASTAEEGCALLRSFGMPFVT
mmetsp:Transcript_140218/g.257441  ORF Transcript_140218/g.257441 Transcript_140218/m.257441 type:complete len:184 (+) Transcript_140218:189-740(+)